jgi:hypothetical protein
VWERVWQQKWRACREVCGQRVGGVWRFLDMLWMGAEEGLAAKTEDHGQPAWMCFCFPQSQQPASASSKRSSPG